MPTYIPDETLLPAEVVEAAGRFVADAYTDLEARLIEAARHRLTPLPESDMERLAAIRLIRQDTERLLARFLESTGTGRLAERVIRVAAEQGSAATVASILATTGQTVTAGSVAFGALALDLSNAFDVLHSRILRFDRDIYQRLIAAQAPDVLTGAATLGKTQRRAVAAFLSEGVNGFTDRAGRNWRIGTYAEMATRTATLRAWSDAATSTMQSAGFQLVTVVIGSTACDACGQYAGQVLSLDGTTGTVTLRHAIEESTVEVTVTATLAQARGNGFQHPNCRCALVAYFPGLDTPGAETTYDPARERMRDTQRKLERDVRQAKRDYAAGTGPKQDISDAQKAVRDHLDDTGMHRQYDREQLWFTDGGPKRRVA